MGTLAEDIMDSHRAMTPRECRMVADHAKEIAGKMTHDEGRAMMLRVANDFERKAERLEQWRNRQEDRRQCQ